MPYKEKKVVKRYFSIGEVAKHFNVTTSLIRFWENEFDIIQPKKNSKGTRSFTQKDIDNLQLIFHLIKEKGFTHEGAKKQLSQKRSDIKKKYQVIDSLKHIRKFLVEIKDNL